ncbi:hypothetical protein F5Y10DRAFT_271041 [Nemania abortiva]|nr:hypothetical protein F5Y10DRAFT_271041 [Nemania abortiva]
MAKALAALGVASSIIAVVQITASVLRPGWSVSSVQDSVTLSAATLLKQPTGPLSACKLAITDIVELVENLKTRKLCTVVTKGASIEKDLESLRQRVERLKTVLLLALHSDQLALSKAIKNLLEDEFQRLERSQELTHDRLDSICTHVEMLITDSQLTRTANQDCEAVRALRWLSDIDHELNHVNAQKLRDDDTGLWFLSCSEFMNWVNRPPD